MSRVLVTGGAGFIGSHLVDRLVLDHEVVVLDDLSAGSIDNINHHMDKNNFSFIKGTITSEEDVNEALWDVETVYHFAAQPDVRLSVSNPMEDFRVNMIGGMTLLEAMRRSDINRLVFASSGGTVYGETEIFPTPEDTVFVPISNYGAAKCAFEMYLSSYSHLYDMCVISLRMGNILGPRLTHGIIYDLYQKLRKDCTCLEVLGTGRQEKAYMYVTDTVEAVMILEKHLKRGHLPVNVSSGERLTVSRIASLVCNELNLSESIIEYTGSERGWAGDILVTDLDIELLKSLGWKSKIKLEEGVSEYIQWLIETYGPVGSR
ncbi:MAG: NAD-dependent epimerase/dehydratase family protein [Candidatus Thorarchaeota archaeon]